MKTNPSSVCAELVEAQLFSSGAAQASKKDGPSTSSGRTGLRVGCLIAGALFGLGTLPAHAQSVEQRIAAYRHRVDLLEDQNAIEYLQATYGYYFDKGLWNQAASLFSPSGSFEYGQRGVYIGVPHIRRAMLLFGPQGLAAGHLNNHMQLQAEITVADDGLTAQARWQGMIQLAAPGQNGIWGVELFENENEKQKSVW